MPLSALRAGFQHDGRRVSFGSFQKKIHRAKEQRGPAALTLTTAPPKPGRPPAYEDVADPESRTILYHYRSGSPDQPDNVALPAAMAIQAPLIYILGIAPGQYHVIAPVFVAEDDPTERMVLLEPGLPYQDTQGEGIISSQGARREQYEHHLAYDRNLLGIDPDGVVHIGGRLLKERDGPMLRSGLQGFHGAKILQPRRAQDRPDPGRLAVRSVEFETAA